MGAKQIKWKNTYQIESDIDLIDMLNPKQSKISINWVKNISNFSLYFDIDNSLKKYYFLIAIDGNTKN